MYMLGIIRKVTNEASYLKGNSLKEGKPTMPIKIEVVFTNRNTGRRKTWIPKSMSVSKLADEVLRRARILYATHVSWNRPAHHYSREYDARSKLDMASFAGELSEYKRALMRKPPAEKHRIVPRDIETIRHHLKVATARGHKEYAARLRQKLVTLQGNQPEEI